MKRSSWRDREKTVFQPRPRRAVTTFDGVSSVNQSPRPFYEAPQQHTSREMWLVVAFLRACLVRLGAICLQLSFSALELPTEPPQIVDSVVSSCERLLIILSQCIWK